MGEPMSMSEIEAQFDSEWVLLEDPDFDEPTSQVKGGTLLWHSKDRGEVYRRALELRPKHSAVLYIGKIPEDIVIVL